MQSRGKEFEGTLKKHICIISNFKILLSQLSLSQRALKGDWAWTDEP